MQVRRPSTPLLASIALHVIVLAFFVQALVLERPLFDVFGRRHAPVEVPIERIGFLALPRSTTSQPPTPGKRGGNGHPLHIPPPVIAPTHISTALPPIPPHTTSRPEPEPGTGPAIGGGGALQGVQPRYTGPELWAPPGQIATAPKSDAQRLDSVITSSIGAHNDSVRMASGNRAPGDWTVERNGKKYGIDGKYIHLGSLSIPTAILAMLPLNITNNPTVSQGQRHSLTSWHDEIFSQAQRAIDDADFEKAVRSIRQRKERERQEQAKQKAADSSAATGSGTGSSP